MLGVNTKSPLELTNELLFFASYTSIEKILCWQRPTLPPKGSTIGAKRLNFSVRNGKRCDPFALITNLSLVYLLISKQYLMYMTISWK